MFKLGNLILTGNLTPRRTSTDPKPTLATAPAPDPTRQRRVCVTMASYPALVIEATPSGALDVQTLAGIKRVEPDPQTSEPDHCGSNYYTVMVSTLYEFRALLQSIEALNEPNLPAVFLED